MSGPDLHLHSTASDGTLSPTELVALAAELRLPAIAITDHDSVSGIPEALDAAERMGVNLIPAVELSAGIGDRGMHILGYYIDHADPSLLERLDHLRAIRVQRAKRIVSALADAGYSLTLGEVLDVAAGGAVGRAHIAQLLVDGGHVASINEAFHTLLGKSAPYYVPKPVSDPAEVIGWIHDAGGLAVLAHPGLSRVDDLIPMLRQAGIAGIEAYHGAHDEESRGRYARLAEDLGLIVTGGSDFHGDSRAGEGMGSANVPGTVTQSLAAVRRMGSART